MLVKTEDQVAKWCHRTMGCGEGQQKCILEGGLAI